jgi:hypothetical protein
LDIYSIPSPEEGLWAWLAAFQRGEPDRPFVPTAWCDSLWLPRIAWPDVGVLVPSSVRCGRPRRNVDDAAEVALARDIDGIRVYLDDERDFRPGDTLLSSRAVGAVGAVVLVTHVRNTWTSSVNNGEELTPEHR